MRKAIIVHLKYNSSFEIRKSLIGHGFEFYVFNRLENSYDPIDKEKSSRTNLHLDPSVELVCIYNADNPSEAQVEIIHKLLQRVHQDPSFIRSAVHTTNGL